LDVDFYAGEFAGIANIGRSWELMTPHSGAQVTVPALYMAGDRDLVVAFHGMRIGAGVRIAVVNLYNSTDYFGRGCGAEAEARHEEIWPPAQGRPRWISSPFYGDVLDSAPPLSKYLGMTCGARQ
jgi:hypothetical protein